MYERDRLTYERVRATHIDGNVPLHLTHMALGHSAMACSFSLVHVWEVLPKAAVHWVDIPEGISSEAAEALYTSLAKGSGRPARHRYATSCSDAEAMAYAALAGLPPEYGLYGSIFPPFIYSLLGTSRELAVGPVAIVSTASSSVLP